MKKLISRILAGGLLVGATTFALAADLATWRGWITDSGCGAKGANAAHAECAARCVKSGKAKWALYDEADKSVWALSDQEGAAKLAGKEVTVKGTADKDKKTITVSSLEEATK